MINSRSIIIVQNTTKLPPNSYIKTDRLLLEQLIINLLSRSVYSVTDNSTIQITIEEIDKRIEIIIEGENFAINEQLLKTILLKGTSYLPIANIQLDIESIERLGLEMGATIQTKSSKKNFITIFSIPIDLRENYIENTKVIPFRPIRWK